MMVLHGDVIIASKGFKRASLPAASCGRINLINFEGLLKVGKGFVAVSSPAAPCGFCNRNVAGLQAVFPGAGRTAG